MILDLISQHNFNRYNIKLAKIIGLQEAIYVEELIDINTKAYNKKTTIKKQKAELPFGSSDDSAKEKHYFEVDRKYIQDRTTLTRSNQIKIDEKLMDLKLLQKDDIDSDVMYFDFEVLTSLFLTKDEKLIKDISSIKSVGNQKATKRQIVIDNIKNSINTGNAELDTAYLKWIDGVYANPKGFLSLASVEIFKNKLDAFCNRDLDVALEILQIATTNGYRDVDWAINIYKKNHAIYGNSVTDKYKF